MKKHGLFRVAAAALCHGTLDWEWDSIRVALLGGGALPILEPLLLYTPEDFRAWGGAERLNELIAPHILGPGAVLKGRTRSGSGEAHAAVTYDADDVTWHDLPLEQIDAILVYRARTPVRLGLPICLMTGDHSVGLPLRPTEKARDVTVVWDGPPYHIFAFSW